MEKSKVLSLLESCLVSSNEFQSLVSVSEASKLISKSLVFSESYQLASDPDILKLLVYSIPINPNNSLFLLQTILVKHQSNTEVFENCWRIFEFIANIEDTQKVLSLHKKYLDQVVNRTKKTIKILELQEEYLLKEIVQLKKYVLKLLPKLFELVQKNYPSTMVDKLFVLKLLKANSKNEEVIDAASGLLEEITLRHCPELQNTERHPIINKTKKHTIKKIQPQNKLAVQKSILQQSVASNSSDIYSLLKSETRTQAFLTYIICPKTIDADQRIWAGIKQGLEIKSPEDIRKEVSIRLLTSRSFVKEMDTHFSDLLVMFFNLIQRFFKETDLNAIIKILTSFLQNSPISVSVMIMQTSFLEKIFYNVEMESVYNFVYTFATLQYKWLKPFKDLFYEYFRLAGFFQLLLNNMDAKKIQYLNPLKAKEFTEIEVKLETRAVELKIDQKRDNQIVDLDLRGIEEYSGQYQFEKPSERNIQTLLFSRNKVTPLSTVSSTSSPKKKSTQPRSQAVRESVQQKKPNPISISIPILPPFAVKQYRGYFSTAPVLNFNIIQKTETIEENENWCYTNCKLYHEILSNLVSESNLELLGHALPSNQQLQDMFLSLRKYRNIPLNSYESNSSIQVSKTLSLILKHQTLRNRYPSLHALCKRNINSMYSIINILFNKQKQPTRIQKLTVHKTLDTHFINMIQLFLLLLKNTSHDDKQGVLDEIDQSLWQILHLLFFDSMLHNIYQTIVYSIFVELFTYGSEILLLNILFKTNLVGTLYNAYSDVMKNGVMITEWHIHSFFIYLSKLYFLINNTQQTRASIPQVSYGLSRMLSWSLLETKIKETFKKDIDQISQFTH